jgi:peroxiredoxin
LCNTAAAAGVRGRNKGYKLYQISIKILITDKSLVDNDGEMMQQPQIVKPGDPAKNFSLKDQNDATFDLYEHMDKKVLLSFHPLAWTAFCAGQMKSLEDNRDVFSALSTVAVGISVDSITCKKAWAENLGISHTPLLCDFWPHGAVAQHYGLFREANGFSERANVIIDEKQTVVFVKVYPVHTVPDIGEVIAVIRNLSTS